MTVKIEVSTVEVIEISTTLYFEAKNKFEGYLLFKDSNKKIAEHFRKDALHYFKLYKRVRESAKLGGKAIL